jgi:starch phosphorylase
MKVLANGGINLSELDGWWVEAYTPEVGWALGDGLEHGDDPAWDAAEADTLYERLEREVVPEFYTRDKDGVPTAWVARMRDSMAQLTLRFSAHRTVREYTEQHYLSAAAEFRTRTANDCGAAKQVVDWQHALKEKWPALHFGETKVEPGGSEHHFETVLFLGDLSPESVKVQLYAEDGTGAPVLHDMELAGPPTNGPSGGTYRASVPATRPAGDYTVRAVPYWPGAQVPLEASAILWQR